MRRHQLMLFMIDEMHEREKSVIFEKTIVIFYSQISETHFFLTLILPFYDVINN